MCIGGCRVESNNEEKEEKTCWGWGCVTSGRRGEREKERAAWVEKVYGKRKLQEKGERRGTNSNANAQEDRERERTIYIHSCRRKKKGR